MCQIFQLFVDITVGINFVNPELTPTYVDLNVGFYPINRYWLDWLVYPITGSSRLWYWTEPKNIV